MRYPILYHEADTETDPQGGASGKTRASDVLEQYGRDALRLAEKLADVQSDNYRLREERRTLKQQLSEAAGKVPAADTRVLSAADAAIFDAYTALGKPADIKQAIDANGTNAAELAKLKRDEQLRDVADAAGYKLSVLKRLAGDMTFEVRPVKDAAPLVVVVADGAETALADYAKDNWSDFLPALAAHGANQQAPDINAGARGNGNGPAITDQERAAASRRYSATF